MEDQEETESMGPEIEGICEGFEKYITGHDMPGEVSNPLENDAIRTVLQQFLLIYLCRE